MSESDLGQAKQAVRERIWALLEEAKVVRPGVHGRIPAFDGADEAAQRLAALSFWDAARVVKTVPDKAQLPVRARALADGKLVYMAVPKLAKRLPFYLLDPRELEVPPEEAAMSEVAAKIGRPVGPDDMQQIDLVVTGCVAVNHKGVRLGKGAGYADIEVALLAEAGLLTNETVIATTVHDLQVVDEELPEAEHDFRVDYVVTPTRVIAVPERKPLKGLDWEGLSEEQVVAIPVLGEMRSGSRAH
ncbi:MAG: 5-formyltetrahydrofolate cyclo-ligase [Nocardioides sp.]